MRGNEKYFEFFQYQNKEIMKKSIKHLENICQAIIKLFLRYEMQNEGMF
jgi:hypothetical protein